jgi:hypothetical protein
LQPYAQQTVVNRPFPKLSYKFFGPYTILERIGAVAYKLQLPATAQVHPVFHISQLKPFVPKYTPVFRELPAIPDLAAAAIEPDEILERRMVRSGNVAATQILIKWRGLDANHATWEDYDLLKLKFPQAPLWERDRSQGGKVSHMRLLQIAQWTASHPPVAHRQRKTQVGEKGPCVDHVLWT